jgi:uncharacterized membrane protein
MPHADHRRKVAVPATLLGIGIGGAVDGIVLHQLLQWHHLLTATGDHPASTVAGLEANTVADGAFHLVALAFVIAGVAMLWARTRRPLDVSWRTIVGYALVGWGLFNVVEGIVDHHILELHHVREVANPLPYDLAFLAFGGLLAAGGWMLARSDAQRGTGSSPAVIRRTDRNVGEDELRVDRHARR